MMVKENKDNDLKFRDGLNDAEEDNTAEELNENTSNKESKLEYFTE